MSIEQYTSNDWLIPIGEKTREALSLRRLKIDGVHKLVSSYLIDLSTAEGIAKLFSKIFPTPFLEGKVTRAYSKADVKFDNKLANFIQHSLGRIGREWTNEEKARYSRWVCSTTAFFLIVNEFTHSLFEETVPSPRVVESCRLTARRALLVGSDLSKRFEGLSIDPEWLNNLISGILQEENVFQATQKFNRFVDSPPREE